MRRVWNIWSVSLSQPHSHYASNLLIYIDRKTFSICIQDLPFIFCFSPPFVSFSFFSQWSRGWVRTWKQPQSMHKSIKLLFHPHIAVLRACEFSPPFHNLNSAVSVTCCILTPNKNNQPTSHENPPMYLNWCYSSHLKPIWDTWVTPCAS